MVRTQVYLDDSVYAKIQILAQQTSQPTAVLIRKYLAAGLAKSGKKETASQALLKLAKIAGKGGPRDLSLNHDYYLYGGKKRRSW